MTETRDGDRELVPDTLVLEVLESIAAETGTDPVDLPPLYAVLDPEALATLVESLPAPAHVEFGFEGCLVTVHADGDVEVTSVDAGPGSTGAAAGSTGG